MVEIAKTDPIIEKITVNGTVYELRCSKRGVFYAWEATLEFSTNEEVVSSASLDALKKKLRTAGKEKVVPVPLTIISVEHQWTDQNKRVEVLEFEDVELVGLHARTARPRIRRAGGKEEFWARYGSWFVKRLDANQRKWAKEAFAAKLAAEAAWEKYKDELRLADSYSALLKKAKGK